MSKKITLTVTRGSLKGTTFVFEEPTRYTIGRAGDCDLSLLHEPGNSEVSRHHCELEIDPPRVLVRDLGSLNGTYVNGQNIGQRPAFLAPECFPREEIQDRLLRPGDEIQVGRIVLSIGLMGAASSDSRTSVRT
jgi:pSer/pThr/pTyr-binding forkhead associated (FHA) protein